MEKKKHFILEQVIKHHFVLQVSTKQFQYEMKLYHIYIYIVNCQYESERKEETKKRETKKKKKFEDEENDDEMKIIEDGGHLWVWGSPFFDEFQIENVGVKPKIYSTPHLIDEGINVLGIFSFLSLSLSLHSLRLHNGVFEHF
jgi:hypothetical protein